MTIYESKQDQIFDITYTTENAGKLGLNIDVDVKEIVLKKLFTIVPTSGVVKAEFYGDNLDLVNLDTAGAAGAVTPTIGFSNVISKGARVSTLAFGSLTKASGLELDFGSNRGLPMLGDSVEMYPSDSVAGDASIFGRRLFVIEVNGTKVKLMSEVPSSVKLPTKGVIYVKTIATSGKQPVFAQGFDVTSVSRAGTVVTFKGSIPKIYGAVVSQGKLVLDNSTPLVNPIKRSGVFTEGFVIISNKLGELKVLDENNLIEANALGANFLGTASIEAVGGFTMIGAPITGETAYALQSTLIDLSMLTGAVVGDRFSVKAIYGGSA